MAKTVQKVTAPRVTGTAQQIWRAGLGAFSLAGEEGGRLFSTLVKRGAKVEKLGRARLDDMFATLSDRVGGRMSDVRESAETARERIAAGVDTTMTGALHTLGIPTRKEIASLARRVEKLTEVMEHRPAKPRRPAATGRRASRAAKAATPPVATA